MLCIWIIGTTVKPRAEAKVGSDAAEYQLWLLGIMYGMQCIYLFLFLPFNDKFENIIVGLVAFNQAQP